MVNLEALAKLAQEATPGPWDSACPPREWSIWSIPRSDEDPGARIIPGLVEADAAYIAAASPDVVLALIARLNAHHRGLTVSGDGPEKCSICAGLDR